MPSSPHVAIRCDRTPAIGAGHLTRCRALADGLVRAGASVGFVLSDASAAALVELQAQGIVALEVPAGPRDAAETAEAARRLGADAIVVDSYEADTDYLDGLARGLTVAVIDDLANRELNPVAWLLNQNLWATPAHYRRHRELELLLGPRYALLRPQFAEERATLARTFAESDDRLLVTFGSSDEACERAAEALDVLAGVGRRLDVRVLLGRAGAPPPRLLQKAAASPHQVEVIAQATSMAAEIARADVSLNAGGSTCWELLALGLPMVVTALSHDQDGNAEGLDAAGLGVALPAGCLDGAAEQVEALFADPERRRRISRRGSTLVDGLGADRAAGSLLTRLARERGHRAA